MLVRRTGELDMVVLMDNANILPGDSEKLFNLVVRVPGTKFILAHIGGLNFRYWNIVWVPTIRRWAWARPRTRWSGWT